MTSATDTAPRTVRVPDAFAGMGAQRQAGGRLPVYECSTCGREVVWATSKRTGRRYLAEVQRGQADQRFYIGANVHTDEACARRIAERDEFSAEVLRREVGARVHECMKAAQRLHNSGAITTDEYLGLLDLIEAAEAAARAEVLA